MSLQSADLEPPPIETLSARLHRWVVEHLNDGATMHIRTATHVTRITPNVWNQWKRRNLLMFISSRDGLRIRAGKRWDLVSGKNTMTCQFTAEKDGKLTNFNYEPSGER